MCVSLHTWPIGQSQYVLVIELNVDEISLTARSVIKENSPGTELHPSARYAQFSRRPMMESHRDNTELAAGLFCSA